VRAAAISGRRCAQDERSNFRALADIVPDNSRRFAASDHDRGLQARLVHDLADSAADDSLDPQFLLFLDRRLDAAPLDEILRLDHGQYVDLATGLGGTARGEAQRDARFGTVIDHDQIGSRHPSSPRAGKLRQLCATGKLFRLEG